MARLRLTLSICCVCPTHPQRRWVVLTGDRLFFLTSSYSISSSSGCSKLFGSDDRQFDANVEETNAENGFGMCTAEITVRIRSFLHLCTLLPLWIRLTEFFCGRNIGYGWPQVLEKKAWLSATIARRSPTEFIISWDSGCEISVVVLVSFDSFSVSPRSCFSLSPLVYSANPCIPLPLNVLRACRVRPIQSEAVFKAQSPQMAERWIGK